MLPNLPQTFVACVYVNGLQNYRRLKHEPNFPIDDLFRENKIEIAFPQRDLHVRSLPNELLNQISGKSEHHGSRQDSGDHYVPMEQGRAGLREAAKKSSRLQGMNRRCRTSCLFERQASLIEVG